MDANYAKDSKKLKSKRVGAFKVGERISKCKNFALGRRSGHRHASVGRETDGCQCQNPAEKNGHCYPLLQSARRKDRKLISEHLHCASVCGPTRLLLCVDLWTDAHVQFLKGKVGNGCFEL